MSDQATFRILKDAEIKDDVFHEAAMLYSCDYGLYEYDPLDPSYWPPDTPSGMSYSPYISCKSAYDFVTYQVQELYSQLQN